LNIQIIDKSQYSLNLGNAIRALRIDLGLSQEKFAERAGLSRTYFSSIEREEKCISVYNLYRILATMEIAFEDFIKKV
jgi:Predicted transcriptional regulators